MKKIRCLIIDDEPLALDIIEGYVLKTPFLDLAGRCTNAFDAIDIINKQDIDLLFLDIEMPDLSGLEFSRTFKNEPRVIFTTAFSKYAIEGFKVNALDFLLKPYNYEEFLTAANKAKEWFDLFYKQKETGNKDNFIYVKADYKQVKIDLKKVLYIEGLKDYVKIYLEDNPKPVLSLLSLKSLEEQLQGLQFMRVHRSFIINLSKIEAIERSHIIIKDIRISISEQYKEKFNKYLSSKSM